MSPSNALGRNRVEGGPLTGRCQISAIGNSGIAAYQSRKMETWAFSSDGSQVNNLLTSMIGYEACRDALEAGDPVGQTRAVLHSADRAAENTQQMLTFRVIRESGLRTMSISIVA